jgi:hypothetical protein
MGQTNRHLPSDQRRIWIVHPEEKFINHDNTVQATVGDYKRCAGTPWGMKFRLWNNRSAAVKIQLEDGE